MPAPLRAPLLASCPRRRAALMDGPLVRPRHGDLFTEGHGGHLEVRLESRRSRMAAGGARGRSGRLWVGCARALRCLDRADGLACCAVAHACAAWGTSTAVSRGAKDAFQRPPGGAAGRPCRYAPAPLASRRAHRASRPARPCCAALRSGWAARAARATAIVVHHLGRGRSAPERASRPHRVGSSGPRAPGARGGSGEAADGPRGVRAA